MPKTHLDLDCEAPTSYSCNSPYNKKMKFCQYILLIVDIDIKMLFYLFYKINFKANLYKCNSIANGLTIKAKGKKIK